jgi:CheY-like chemotaxis protein
VPITDRVAMVLTDLEMPEMDGFTLTRLIKQDPRFGKIPVVIHSSLSGKTNEDHVKGVGADAYVAKFSAEDLAGTIRNVLGKAAPPLNPLGRIERAVTVTLRPLFWACQPFFNVASGSGSRAPQSKLSYLATLSLKPISH